jgi:hypothetical protein
MSPIQQITLTYVLSLFTHLCNEPFHLIKYIATNIPIIANKHSKPSIGESVGLGEGV